jgi:methylglutaconyl-CoA hydratase
LKKNLTIANNPCLEKILQPCMEDKALQHSLVSTKDKLMVNQNHGSPGCNGEARLVSLETDKCAMRPPKLVQKNDTTKEAESKAEIQAEKPNISTSLAKSFSNGSSTCTSNKENDGFVTTRKNSCKRSNDENSWKKPEKTLLQCSTSTGAVPLACEKNGVAKRKALTEATNLQQSNVMEITGKWQCPQKRKPDRGPALKQLRLERWVHKAGNISPH